MVLTPNIGVLMSKSDVKTIEKLKSYVTFEEDYAVALDMDFRGLCNEALREIIDSAIDSRSTLACARTCSD